MTASVLFTVVDAAPVLVEEARRRLGLSAATPWIFDRFVSPEGEISFRVMFGHESDEPDQPVAAPIEPTPSPPAPAVIELEANVL